MGVIESMTLMPVWTGVSTFCRVMTPGATTSTARNSFEIDLALAVERATERVNDPADELRADAGLHDPTRGADHAAFLDARVIAEDDRAHGVLFEVEREPEDVLAEVEELGGHAAREPVDPGDAVADLNDRADVGGLGLTFEPFDLGLDDVGDLRGGRWHFPPLIPSQTLTERVQLGSHGRIDEVITELDLGAGDQRLVYGEARFDPMAGCRLQTLHERLPLRLIEREPRS